MTDEQLDLAVAGRSLAGGGRTRHAAEGAHDPTPTPCSVLDELLGPLDLSGDSHLLDVGCGEGRVLAYFVGAGLPGRVTGVELDRGLAERAAAWSARYDNVRVVAGSALELPLGEFTHVYLFNPFDTPVLEAFLDRLEREARGPVTLVHMSDNGEWPAYLGRAGWELLREGFLELPGEKGDCPQHFSVRPYIGGTKDGAVTAPRPLSHRYARHSRSSAR